MSLLRNNGDGTFEDVTEAAGLLSMHPTQTAAWAAYDNDGWLDLFVGHESVPDDPHPSQLFHNNHDGTFTEVGAANGLANLGFVKGVAWGDVNNDGRPDLFVSVKGSAKHLFRNDGPRDPEHPRADRWKFTDVTEQAHVDGPSDSFATWFFDYDNDGWPDIFIAGYSTHSMNDVGAFEVGHSHHAELPRLYHNNRNGTFTDVTAQEHLDRAILTMGANFGDLDNDGWLDIYLGTGEPAYEALLPNRMFRNHEGREFQDVTTSGGFGHLQKGDGIAFADVENNGNEDVIEELGAHFPVIPISPCSTAIPATATTGSLWNSKASRPTGPHLARASHSPSKTAMCCGMSIAPSDTAPASEVIPSASTSESAKPKSCKRSRSTGPCQKPRRSSRTPPSIAPFVSERERRIRFR